MLETVVFGAFCVLGLYAAMAKGMVLEPLKRFFELITDNQVLRHVRPALYECPICMASIWGTVVWLMIGNWFTLTWILYVFGVAGFNYVMVNIIDND